MNADLDAFAIALYVAIDDVLADHPEWTPKRPTIGLGPKLSDAELCTLSVIQALLGYTSEAQFIRYAHTHLTSLFPYLPQRPGYNKRLRAAAATIQHVIDTVARDCPSWHDDLWLVDSTPVECGRSTTDPPRSKPSSTSAGSHSSDRRSSPKGEADHRNDSSNRSARSSSRSTRPSKPNSISNATADANPPAYAPASCNESSPSPPPSGTTKQATNLDPHDHSWPTTTDGLGANHLGTGN